MNSIKKQARVAGLLYLLASIPAPFALIYVPGTLIVRGDATATGNHIRASENLFHLGIASELFGFIMFIFVVLALYRLFKGVSEKHALAMAILLLVSIPISLLNVLNEIAALVLVSGANFLSVFETRQLDALAYVFLRLHGQGFVVAQIFWGLWLFPFGILVIRSGFIPRVGLLAVHCRFRLYGQFLYLPPSATVHASCRSVRDGSYDWGIADNLLAFDLGCKRSTIRRATFRSGYHYLTICICKPQPHKPRDAANRWREQKES